MEIRERIEGLPPDERAVEKAAALASRPLPVFETQGLVVTVTALEADGPRLIVHLEATKNGQPTVVDGPFIYHNPPILVRDGEGLVEDHDAVLEEMVAETLRVTWRP